MKRTAFHSFFAVMGLMAVLLTSSCNKKPEGPGAPLGPVTYTKIADFRALYDGSDLVIPSGKTIKGVVVSNNLNEAAGNYRVQDETGGVILYAAVGSPVYTLGTVLEIDASAGGVLTSYNGDLELKSVPMASVKISTDAINITPRVTTAKEAVDNKDTWSSTLITLNNVTITRGSTSSVGQNYTVTDATGELVCFVRTTSGITVPTGNATSITGYISIFNSTTQIGIRKLEDIVGSTPPPPGTQMTMAAFRALKTDPADLTVPAGTKLKGVVVSNSANEASGNYRVQDETGGVILFTALGSPVYPLGTVLEIEAGNGGVLTLYNGDLELKSVASQDVVVSTDPLTITPRVTTGQAAITNIGAWASTLVTLSNVTITKTTSNATGTNYTVVDATGTLAMFVRTAAGITVPEGKATSITGYLSVFNGASQIGIRKAEDIVGGGGPVDPPPTGDGIILGSSSPLLIDFNSIGTGLPTGVSVQTNAVTATPTTITFSGSPIDWKNTGGGFKNFASATGLTAATDAVTQSASTDRALGVRQVGNTSSSFPNSEPGAAFVFQIANTTGKTGLKMDFLLQSLDGAIARTATWTVQYSTDGTTFNNATSVPSPLTTGNSSFASTATNVDFGNALDNQSGNVWIRIVVLTATTGSGSRPSTAIDDVKFSWN